VSGDVCRAITISISAVILEYFMLCSWLLFELNSLVRGRVVLGTDATGAQCLGDGQSDLLSIRVRRI